MRITGERGRGNLGYINVEISCEDPKHNGQIPISMAVDSGASVTVISESDAILLEIDYALLKHSPHGFTGIGGSCDRYLLNDVTLSFKVTDKEYHIEKVESISVMKHEIHEEKCPECGHEWVPREDEKRASALTLPSLLGMDVLSRFNIRYTPTKIFLEK